MAVTTSLTGTARSETPMHRATRPRRYPPYDPRGHCATAVLFTAGPAAAHVEVESDDAQALGRRSAPARRCARAMPAGAPLRPGAGSVRHRECGGSGERVSGRLPKTTSIGAQVLSTKP